MAGPSSKKKVAIVGAGISGLAAARKLIDAGYEVDIFEPKNRTGGIIETFYREDGRIADRAAEFIDSDQHAIIKLCNELGVKLMSTQDSGKPPSYQYSTNAGRMLNDEQFNREYAPIAEQVVRDKEIIKADPYGERAQYLDTLSMPQYIAELAASANADHRPIWEKIFLFWQKPAAVNSDIIDAVIQAFGSERGRPADRLSALQFVHEAGPTPDVFIASDCAYRVEGGTTKLIQALQKDLESKGARFHFGEKATKIDKQGGQYALEFNEKAETKTFDKVVFATQGYNLAAMQGLDKIGFSAEEQDTLKQLQYSHNTKITVKTRDRIPNDSFFLSNAGYQTWPRDNHSIVFYIGGDLPNRFAPNELVDFVLNDYAKAHGLNADQFFDKDQINFNGPSVQNACCAAPGVGQSLRLQRLADSFDRLAEEGIGVVGTFVPQHKAGDRACGYMGNGIESVDRMASIMAPQREMGDSPRMEQEQQQPGYWMNRVQTDRAVAAQQAPYIGAG